MRTKSVAAIATLLVTVSMGSAVKSQEVKNSSYVTDSGQRVLRQEMVVPVPPDSVWYAFTTVSGMTSWMVPIASIDLKTGGDLETSYNPAGKLGDPDNIHNTVLSFIPNKMFSFRIGLTAQFPEEPRKAGSLFYVILLDDLGNGQTRVEGSMLGWGDGDQWDEVYKKFERGNEYTFHQLYKRFTHGPITWKTTNGPSLK